MKGLGLLLVLFLPTTAFALSAQDKADIADKLTKAYPSITVSVVSAPIISGDQDPVIFRISPSGKPNYGQLFLKEQYNIIFKPNTPGMLGSYACDIANEFVKKRREAQANFLPHFEVKLGVSIRVVEFEIRGDQDTLSSIIYAVLFIRDALSNDYDKFNILIRGYADRGGTFQRALMKEYPYHDISFFPLKTKPDPFMTVYLRRLDKKQVGSTYNNDDLPDLRATFMKREVIDRFLDECRLSRPGANIPESIVLDGGVIDVNDPDQRTVDIFFYAYR
jgi:hypothetical protein